MLRRLLGTAAATVDRAALATVLGRSRRSRERSRAESLGHADRMRALDHIGALYGSASHLEQPGTFFLPPPRADARWTFVREIDGGVVVDVTWPSGSRVAADEIAERYGAHAENDVAAARLWLHVPRGWRTPSGRASADRAALPPIDRPRAAAMLVHGYRCGQYPLEERAWPMTWLFERGLDLALAVLPFHAVRAPAPTGPFAAARALFPSSDPRVTIEGFRHAVHDLRALSALLRGRGGSAVGAMGMSLGGYTSALLGTATDDLAFLAPIIPLASIADFARAGGRYVGTPEEQELQHAALDVAHRVVSPLARPPRIAPDRVLVVAGENDRITPVAHARRLAAHFGAPLELFPGGHLLQVGRAEGFRAIGKLLGRLGILDPR